MRFYPSGRSFGRSHQPDDEAGYGRAILVTEPAEFAGRCPGRGRRESRDYPPGLRARFEPAIEDAPGRDYPRQSRTPATVRVLYRSRCALSSAPHPQGEVGHVVQSGGAGTGGARHYRRSGGHLGPRSPPSQLWARSLTWGVGDRTQIGAEHLLGDRCGLRIEAEHPRDGRPRPARTDHPPDGAHRTLSDGIR